MAAPRDVSIFDPELGAILATIPEMPPFTKEILPAFREASATPLEAVLAACPLTHEEVIIDGPGSKLTLSIFRPKAGSTSPVGQAGRPGIYHIHGGGMIMMNRFAGVEQLSSAITDNNAVLITIEYRLIPEHPAPAQLDDCYAGLVWMFDHAKELGVDPNRIMVAGLSAGGGLSAGVALMARDRNGPKLCAQVLMCPMLDDTVSTHSTNQFATGGSWWKHQNVQAWKWYLDGKPANQYTSPTRCTDASGLPPTFIDVGALEIFRDEDVAYANKLWAAGVHVELHVWPGAFHAFELLAPQAVLSQLAIKTRADWIGRIFAQKALKL